MGDICIWVMYGNRVGMYVVEIFCCKIVGRRIIEYGVFGKRICVDFLWNMFLDGL